MRSSYFKNPPIEPDIHKWPVYKLSQDRDYFIRQLRTFVFNRMTENGTRSVRAVLERALYMERTRIHENPWKVDPPDERVFWSKVRKSLPREGEDYGREATYQILQDIIGRYAQEIVGTFSVRTFRFARRFLTIFFARLLNTIADRSIWSRRFKLHDKLQVVGEIELIRELMQKGTVIVVPTHSSNLDSILIGYMLDSIVGLPSFSYGAGLNLYNTGIVAFFMNRLGAYRVDRRKKNLIYLETLKAFSRLSIEKGVNSLFFPGGTRSRSGRIENKLKIGLLSTAVEAQRSLYQEKKDKKIFIVPLNVSYHFVLEAGTLIHQHLRAEGKERFIVSRKDESYSIRKNIKFIWKLFSNTSEITFSFGQPMDVLGNPVDHDGISLDNYHRPIDVRDFFRLGDQVTTDLQRESQYSRTLAERIVHSYYRDHVVLSSSFVAFLAFEILRKEHPHLDIFGVMKLPPDDYRFDWDSLRRGGLELQEALIRMAGREEVKLSDVIRADIDTLLQDGMKNLGVYHAEKPIYLDRKGVVRSESFKLLYFYHNRLEGYRLDEQVEWQQLVVAVEE